MQSELPIPITTDSDLSFYEEYLNREFTEITPKKPQDCLQVFLKSLVKIDCGNINKIGILEHIGEDFLIITSQNRRTAVSRNSVKFITILQNSTKSPNC